MSNPYDKSVEKMRAAFKKERDLKLEIARELYLMKYSLLSQKGQREHIFPSWKEYCEEIGITVQGANYWINKFIPREVSPTGKDVLLLRAPAREQAAGKKRRGA